MSWENCGFKPGKINGPAKCSRQCDGCDGDHHFLVDAGMGLADEDFDPEEPPQFICKHCGVMAEMVDEDE